MNLSIAHGIELVKWSIIIKVRIICNLAQTRAIISIRKWIELLLFFHSIFRHFQCGSLRTAATAAAVAAAIAACGHCTAEHKCVHSVAVHSVWLQLCYFCWSIFRISAVHRYFTDNSVPPYTQTHTHTRSYGCITISLYILSKIKFVCIHHCLAVAGDFLARKKNIKIDGR